MDFYKLESKNKSNMNINQVKLESNWSEAVNTINKNNEAIGVELTKVASATTKFKGFFTSESQLIESEPLPKIGYTAWVGETYPGVVYNCTKADEWTNTGIAATVPELPVKDELGQSTVVAPSQRLLTAELAEKDKKIVQLEVAATTLDASKAEKTALAATNASVATIQVNVDNQLQEQDAAFQSKAAEEFKKNKDYVDGKSIEILPESVTPEALSPATKQLINASGGGTINNLPDDEDLEVVGDVLKFKDKEYQPQNFSGLGRKILRKNITTPTTRRSKRSVGKNVLTQDMINQANTVYDIMYDYDLEGATIRIPAGCSLRFDGGSFSNGTIVGNLTRIEACIVHVFNAVTLSGSYAQEVIYPEWFGAKGFHSKCSIHNDENITVGSTALNIPKEVDTLPDSAPAFNQALNLSTMSGGIVKCQDLIYKLNSTIHVKTRATLELHTDTILVPYMEGNGLTVFTQNEDTGVFTTETLIEPPIALASNQIFADESMSTCIAVSSIRAAIIGGGTISLIRSKRTIGIKIMSMGYQYDDLNYLSPDIDAKIIGGTMNENSPNVYDSIGIVAPTDTELNESGSTKYYWDRLSKTLYKKNNKSTTWARWGNVGDADPRWNTGMRFYMIPGWSGARILNPRIKIGISFGARGIEVFCRPDATSSWFNECVMDGAISYTYSHYVSVFVPKEVSVSNQYWNSLIQQNKSFSMEDSSIFYAIVCGNLNLGYCWDLSWIGTVRKRPYFLGKLTRSVNLGSLDRGNEYVSDFGLGNIYSGSPVHYMHTNQIAPVLNSKVVHNILKYNSLGVLRGNTSSNPNEYMYYKTYGSPPIIKSLHDDLRIEENRHKSIDSCVFDEDYRTSTLAVDTDAGIYGISFDFHGISAEAAFQQGRFCRAIMIEYAFEGQNGNLYENRRNFNVTLSFGGEQLDITENLYRPATTTNAGTKRLTECVFIPIRTSQQLYTPVIAIYADKETPLVALHVVNIKFLTDTPIHLPVNNSGYPYKVLPSSSALVSGPSNRRPTACPKGHVYYDTTLECPVINIGNSSLLNWKPLRIDQYTTKGTTAQRPVLTSSDASFQYYDTNLRKYICWSGSAWTNLDGSTL